MGSSLDWLDLGESNRDLGEGSGVLSEDLIGFHDACLDDLDRLMGGSVSAAHLGVYKKARDQSSNSLILSFFAETCARHT